jgi:hypothetical protein
MRPGLERTTILHVVGGAMLAVLFLMAWDAQWWLSHLGVYRQRNREHVLSAYRALRLGMSGQEAAAVVSRLSAAGFLTHGSCQATNTCVAEAPSEFGARNWMLYLQFHDNRLSAVRIRTADSALEHPETAPPDVGHWSEPAPKEAAAQQ